MTFGLSSDVVIHRLRRGGRGRRSVQLHRGGGCSSERASVQSSADLVHTLQKRVTHRGRRRDSRWKKKQQKKTIINRKLSPCFYLQRSKVSHRWHLVGNLHRAQEHGSVPHWALRHPAGHQLSAADPLCHPDDQRSGGLPLWNLPGQRGETELSICTSNHQQENFNSCCFFLISTYSHCELLDVQMAHPAGRSLYLSKIFS